MTAETRKIRPYDVLRADEASDTHEFGAGGLDTGPAALAGAAAPFNDNAREGDAHEALAPARSQDAAFDDADVASDVPAESPTHTRRRGPLVTRWIGFAAQRRRTQARVSRMQNRQD